MNMAIRGMDFDFGKEPANTFTRDQHPDLRADFIMANPPFNMKEWNAGVKDDDPRWKYGIPPAGNANFAWMQHMIHHLAPNGSMALLLANGSMSSNTNNEGEIRKAIFAKIGEALRQNRLRQIVRETIVDNNMMGAVPRVDKIDPRFFYYALSQFDFSRIAQGTALPYLPYMVSR